MGVFNSNNYGLLAACRYVRSYYVYVLASRRINSKGSHSNVYVLANDSHSSNWATTLDTAQDKLQNRGD